MKQTSAYLESGSYLARPLHQAAAGAFSLGYWTDDGSVRKEPHGHVDAHFMLVTSGHYETEAPDRGSETLLIFNPPGIYHDDRLHGGGAFFTITIPRHVWEVAGSKDAPRGPVRARSPYAFALARRALREAASWSGDSAPVSEALCWEMMGLICTERCDERKRPAWLARACDHLRRNCGSTVDLRQMCREIGVHPVHLSRTFRKFLGCTPGEYLRARRLARAARLLTAGGVPIAEIATVSGFTDQSHLNRHFTRAYGVSPARYRRLTSADRRPLAPR